MNLFALARRHRMARRITCSEVAERLQQYLDGELVDATAPLVEAHLEMCRRCGLEASIYRDVKDSLANRTAPSPDAVERLRAFGEQVASGGDGLGER